MRRYWRVLFFIFLLLYSTTLVIFVPPAKATFTYTTTNTTSGISNVFSCDGVTTSGASRYDLVMQQGGSGGTSVGYNPSLTSLQTAIGLSLISPSSDPGLTSWPAGNWTVNLDVGAGDTQGPVVWDGACIFEVNSTGTSNIALVGSNTGLAISLNAAGTKSTTISGSAETTLSSARIYIEYVFLNQMGTTRSYSWTSDAQITTPLSGTSGGFGGKGGGVGGKGGGVGD